MRSTRASSLVTEHIRGKTRAEIRQIHRSVDCPRCGATPGDPCMVTYGPRIGSEAQDPHSLRVHEARGQLGARLLREAQGPDGTTDVGTPDVQSTETHADESLTDRFFRLRLALERYAGGEWHPAPRLLVRAFLDAWRQLDHCLAEHMSSADLDVAAQQGVVPPERGTRVRLSSGQEGTVLGPASDHIVSRRPLRGWVAVERDGWWVGQGGFSYRAASRENPVDRPFVTIEWSPDLVVVTGSDADRAEHHTNHGEIDAEAQEQPEP